MPAEAACPISGVDRALSSYINSRDDTLRIRRTLSRYLAASFRPVNHATQDQHVNHECPQGFSATNANPPGLKDSRISYLHALRMRSQAEAKHRELQASLEDLQNQHVDENPILSQSEYDNESARGYISLLRQRRKLAELNVVQESLEKLLGAKPFNHSNDPRDYIQEAIGEQPDLPAERLEQITQPEDNQNPIFKLEQEVLEARLRMDRASAKKKQAYAVARDQPGLHEQVQALERARSEIVEWIQGELAKMEEDSIFLEDASPIKRPVQEKTPLDLDTAEVHIRTSYDQYVACRVKLIEAYESFNMPLPKGVESGSEGNTQETSRSNEDAKSVMPVAKIFPYLPLLARSAQNERSLLQQTVFLQSQFAGSDQELEEGLLRLSGESHLLPAGSRDASAWGKVAMDAESVTEKVVEEHMYESRQEVSSISAIVDICSLHSKVLASV